MGATNPDRYLKRVSGPLFPIVGFVHRVGITQPGEWTADVVEYWMDWPASPDELERQRPAHEVSHASIWRVLRKPYRRRARLGS